MSTSESAVENQRLRLVRRDQLQRHRKGHHQFRRKICRVPPQHALRRARGRCGPTAARHPRGHDNSCSPNFSFWTVGSRTQFNRSPGSILVFSVLPHFNTAYKGTDYLDPVRWAEERRPRPPTPTQDRGPERVVRAGASTDQLQSVKWLFAAKEVAHRPPQQAAGVFLGPLPTPHGRGGAQAPSSRTMRPECCPGPPLRAAANRPLLRMRSVNAARFSIPR